MDVVNFGGLGIFAVLTVGMIGVVALLVVAAIVFIIISIVRNTKKVTAAGLDPMTLQTDLAVKALDSSLLAPSASIEERLAANDDLLARKVITAAEHAEARSAILASS
jgi:uncharacterized membrane protein